MKRPYRHFAGAGRGVRATGRRTLAKEEGGTNPKHRGEVRIGTVTYECFILDGGTRVLSQRTTLKALGAEGKNTSVVIIENTRKTSAPKRDSTAVECAVSSNDSKDFSGAPKLRFHPPEGNTVIVGYTVYQVLDLLRDWQGRLVRGECPHWPTLTPPREVLSPRVPTGAKPQRERRRRDGTCRGRMHKRTTARRKRPDRRACAFHVDPSPTMSLSTWCVHRSAAAQGVGCADPLLTCGTLDGMTQSVESIRTQIADLQRRAAATESEEARAKVAELVAQAKDAAAALALVESEQAKQREEARARTVAAIEGEAGELDRKVKENNAKIGATLDRFGEVERLAQELFGELDAAIEANVDLQEERDDLARKAQALGFQAPSITEPQGIRWATHYATHYAATAMRAAGSGPRSSGRLAAVITMALQLPSATRNRG